MGKIRFIKENQTITKLFTNLTLLAKDNFITVCLRLSPVIASLLAIPIILKQIGVEGFGVYSLYITFISLSTILDFGYVNVNMYKFQDAYLGSNFNLAKSVYNKFQNDLLKMAAIESTMFLFIAFPIIVLQFFNSGSSINPDLLLAALIMLSFAPFHVLQNFINRILICMNKQREALFFNSLNLILVSVTLVFVSEYTSSIALLIFISTFLPICSFAYQLIRLNKQLRLKVINSIESKIKATKFNLSSNFTIIQVFAFLSLGIDPFLIATFVTNETIAVFTIVSKILVLLVSIMSWVQIKQLNFMRQIVLSNEYSKLSQNWHYYTRNWALVSIFSIPILTIILEVFIKSWTHGLIDITFLGSFIAILWAHMMVLSNYAYQILYSLEDHHLGRNAIVLTVLLKIFLTCILFFFVHEFWVPLLCMSLSIITIYIPITFFTLSKNRNK
jgi:hypothetical protein